LVGLAAQSRRLAGKVQAIPWLYAEIVRLLSVHELVHLIVEDANAEQRVRGILERAGANLDRVSFHAWPTDRGWTRDSGAIFVRNREGRVAITNWHFNAWAKYSDWQLDDQVPGRVAALLGLPSGSLRLSWKMATHIALCSKAAPSTSTVREFCSPPRSVS